MSVKKKPLVVVTRKLPDSIETRMRELFDARINLDDIPMSAEQIAEAVTRQGIPIEVIRFPDEGHGVVKLKNKLIAYPAIADFLDRHL